MIVLEITVLGIMLTSSGEPDPALVKRVAPSITALTCDVLGKRAGATMALVRSVPRAPRFVRGRSVAEHGRDAFRPGVTLTDETSTGIRKARCRRGAFDLPSEFASDVREHSDITSSTVVPPPTGTPASCRNIGTDARAPDACADRREGGS